MAKQLKLKNMYYYWSDEETEILKRYYLLEGKKVANRLPYKTQEQCLHKACELKLKYRKTAYSKYRYVVWSKRDKKWVVMFKVNGKNKYFGLFTDEDEAGRVAMEKAKEYGKIK